MVCCTITDPSTERAVIAAYKKGRVFSNAARQFIYIVKQAALTLPALQDVNFPAVHAIMSSSLGGILSFTIPLGLYRNNSLLYMDFRSSTT